MNQKKKVAKVVIETLETDRLYLRQIAQNDAPALLSVWSDPAVTKYMNAAAFAAEAQVLEMIQLLRSLALQNRAMRYTIFQKQTGQIIGSCGFNTFDTERGKTEIGYELGSAFWGRGYGKEAVVSLSNAAFEQLGFVKVEAKVAPANKPSIRVLEKAGFEFENMLDGKNIALFSKRKSAVNFF